MYRRPCRQGYRYPNGHAYLGPCCGEAMTTRRHVPPSRLRYEASHPTVAVHCDVETKARLVALREATGLPLGALVKQGSAFWRLTLRQRAGQVLPPVAPLVDASATWQAERRASRKAGTRDSQRLSDGIASPTRVVDAASSWLWRSAPSPRTTPARRSRMLGGTTASAPEQQRPECRSTKPAEQRRRPLVRTGERVFRTLERYA